MRRAFLPVASASCVLALATPAFAQEAEVSVSPAPVVGVAVTPTPAPVAAVAVIPATPAASAKPKAEEKKDEEKKKEEEDNAHFRFGMGLDANYIYGPKTSTAPSLNGFGAGLEFRLGAQIMSWFAAYYQPHAILGGTISESAPSVPAPTGVKLPKLPSATLIGAVFNSGLIEATLPVLHIGAGPSADIIGVKNYALLPAKLGGPPVDAGGTSAYFGVDGRVAIVIGGHGPGSHAGFAINGNVHPTFFHGTTLLTFSLGIGGEFY